MSSSESWDTQICLGLGSNIGDSREHLRRGIKSLRGILGEGRVSSLYSTDPQELLDQPRFLNCAFVGHWHGSMFELLNLCRKIEVDEGRVRDTTLRFGPRTLDIDLLWADKVTLESPSLTIPHERLTQRAFALIPLLELLPNAEHQGARTQLSKNLQLLSDQGVYQVEW